MKNKSPKKPKKKKPDAIAVSTPENTALPVEIGGRPGPDPTRYGDWEMGGRCVDF